MNSKKIIFIFIITIILVTIFTGIINKSKLKSINKRDIDVLKFIEVTDEVSDNKVQVNWKYVCSIIAVKEKNIFKNISEEDIKNVANLFIYESKNGYKLKMLDKVLEELDFSDSEKLRVKKYVENLKYHGLVPSRINKDTKYSKFIDELKPKAIENYKEYKILPSITIAQAILESAWGESYLSKNANNLFGIKADSSWDGEFVTMETLEYNDDKIYAKFRKYKDKLQSINDHGQFLAENERYESNGVFQAKTYIHQAKALENAGYSTAIDKDGNKIYAKKLISIIKQYNLQLIDSEVQENIKL